MTNAYSPATAPFAHDRFLARRKIFELFSPKFYFSDELGNAIGFCKQKAFKLKEDIRLYTDQTMSHELLHIRARKILDFSSAYDVIDSATQQQVGALKRRGLKSILKDEWVVMDSLDQDIGRIVEDSTALALARRFVTDLIPQKFRFIVRGHEVGTAAQNWNFFAPKLSVDLTGDPGRELDRRLAIAAVILLLAIEGRQG
ncbi:MAG TPA: hypothetical protein VFY29_15835 [Terriglobia bacterium]|nr:hypothetical protein [Terriglobia bacterium]